MDEPQCPFCKNEMELDLVEERREGGLFTVYYKCSICGFQAKFDRHKFEQNVNPSKREEEE